jgi:hypothetical protein
MADYEIVLQWEMTMCCDIVIDIKVMTLLCSSAMQPTICLLHLFSPILWVVVLHTLHPAFYLLTTSFFFPLVVKVSRIKGFASFSERIVLPASHQNESFPKSKTKAK